MSFDFNKDIQNNFDNMETHLRKSSVISERVNLISSHMYKQFLEYQHAVLNTTDMFYRMMNDVDDVVNTLKQSFSSRGVQSSGIISKVNAEKNVIITNILWHSISFTMKGNTMPKALHRENNAPLFTGRITAFNGDLSNYLFNSQNQEISPIINQEIASLYVPAEKTEPAVMKIKHIGNKEFKINQIDASREFLLKVIEIICGGGIYHED